MATQRYTIQDGDTIHQIARRLLHAADQWVVLAEYNRLDWPYVDTTGTTYAAGQRVLRVGDTLLVPDALSGPEVQRAAQHIDAEPYTILLGVDMTLDVSGDLDVNAATGDWHTIAGVANLQQALLHRLMTRRGELAYHPRYGSNLDEHLGHPLDRARVGMLRLDLLEAILEEPRIRAVPALTIQAEHDHVAVQIHAEVIGIDDVVPLNLVLAH